MIDFDPFRLTTEPKHPQDVTIETQLDEHEPDLKKLMDALWVDVGGEG